jgi:eukaryotic-like serine/threonine-protein kinase
MSDRGKQLFGEAVELPPSERAAFLAAACGDDPALQRSLAALLHAHEVAGDFLAHPAELVAAAAVEVGDDEAAFAPGEHVGNYELLAPLGRGGAGIVWRARQLQPVVRDVALKLLHTGHDGARSTRHFRAEWQLLARMQHPGVAKVFEAGVLADGRPWLAMELVDGAPITQHTQELALSLRARLELFVDVCRAVQHAHQKGVVHRDLKPANVLVTLRDGAPRPVVIDFGVAAANDGGEAREPDDGALFGTPEYMSPEQAAADAAAVDVRTDVHALGVLLYELAGGERPYRRPAGPDGTQQLLRAIRSETPPPPSRRASQPVPSDLDRVVACAMAKDPAARYPSAAALADDVVRVLASEPIAAAPTSPARRLVLFVRRHRLGALAAVAIALATGFGLAAAAHGYREARRAEQAARADQQRAEDAAQLARAERDRAARETQKATRALDLLDELWGDVDKARLSRSDYPVHELLRDFELALPRRTDGEPEVELRLRQSFARLQNFAGNGERAEVHATRAIALARALGSAASEVEALLMRARAHFDRGDLVAAESDTADAIALAAPERGVTPPARAAVLELHADCLARANRLGEALIDAGAALQLREREPLVQDVARSQMQMARLRGSIGHVEPAMVHAQKALELLAPFGDAHPDAVAALQHLALLQQRRGDQAAAEASFREGLRRRRRIYGDDHAEVAWAMSDLAWLLHVRGRDGEAAPLLRDALAMLRRHLGEDHLYVTETMQRLGTVATERSDLDEAEQLLTDAAERYASLPGHPVEGHLSVLGNLASLQWRRGDRAKARATQQFGVDRATQLLPREHFVVSVGMTNLAWMASELGELDTAVALLREALARSDAAGRAGEAAVQRKHLDELLRRQGEVPEAAGSSGR